MAKTEYNPEAMDLAAEKALNELESMDPAAVLLLGNWFKEYYMSAGHRRLGRILIQYAIRADVAQWKSSSLVS